MDGSLDALSALTGSRADSAPEAAPSDVASSGDTSGTIAHSDAMSKNVPAVTSPQPHTKAQRCFRLQYADANPPGIAVRHASELSYEEFVVHYMAPNVPVVIKVRQS
jgi:hypothetical protein